MKQLIIFATGNKGKIREIRDIITDPDTEVLSMREAGVAADPDENGTTFEENALIKCRAVRELICQKIEDGSFAVNTEDAQITVMSDDSGLVIDALGGEPGIYSARYLGHDTDYNYKMEQIMKRMEDVPEEKRTARFVAAVGAIFPDGTEHVATGAMEGRIAHGIYGQNGFGYDPARPARRSPRSRRTRSVIAAKRSGLCSMSSVTGAPHRKDLQAVNDDEDTDPGRYPCAGRYFSAHPLRRKGL